MGYSLWSCKESDVTEVTKHACTDFAVAKRYLCWGARWECGCHQMFTSLLQLLRT